MRRIVTIMGTDGSGKTTLASALVSLLREEGLGVTREWLGAESYIMAPIRKVLRLRWRRAPTPEDSQLYAGYTREVAQKHAVVTRYRWAKRFYVAAVLLDYRVQLTFKFLRNRRCDLLVADRYLFDVVVNLGLTLGLSPQEAVELAQREIARVPLPKVRVFLRVEPETSMQRKDDIPDIEYLRLRLQYYDAIAAAFGFVVLDGTRSIEENCCRLREHLYDSLARPHIHYVHANNEDVGGADLVLVSMARHMRSWGQGYRTSVSLRLATAAVRAHADSGTPVLLKSVVRPQVAAGARGLFKLAILGPSTFIYFLRLFGREQPDIVHVNDLYDFLPALAARVHGIPVVYHIRMIKSGAIRQGFKVLLPRLSSNVIFVSEAVRRVYESGASRSARQHVIHDLGNATLMNFTGDVSSNAPRPRGLPPVGRLVVMVGRIEEWKGQRVFLAAVDMLPAEVREKHVFALVGGGVPGRYDYLREVLMEAERLGVHWLGTRDDVPALLLAADVSVHCSIEPDPFPGVVIESLLAGTATIAADAGGVPEIVDSSDVGLRYRPGDAATLSNHLLALLSGENSPRTLYSAAARARALQLVAPGSVNAKIDNVYRNLLVGPSRSAVRPKFSRQPMTASMLRNEDG